MSDKAQQTTNILLREAVVKAINVGRMSVALSDSLLILLGYAIANPTYIFLLQHPPVGEVFGEKVFAILKSFLITPSP